MSIDHPQARSISSKGPICAGKGSSSCEFRFYEELNDFLAPPLRKKTIHYRFNGSPSVKDAIQALGIPHTEVDLVLVNGRSVSFTYHLRGNAFISVYPMFEAIDVSPLQRLRPVPLRETKFVLDVHLGKLARLLRLAGFDTLYQNDYSDEFLIQISVSEHRILLTRDCGILKQNRVTHGLFVHATNPTQQIMEVIQRLNLQTAVAPFSRCLVCNGVLRHVENASVDTFIPDSIKQQPEAFYRCSGCRRIYWGGSHYKNLFSKLLDMELHHSLTRPAPT